MSTVTPSGLNYIDSLLGKHKWEQNLEAPAVISFSFQNEEEVENETRLPITNPQYRNVIREALLAWERVANIHFVEDSQGNGQLTGLFHSKKSL